MARYLYKVSAPSADMLFYPRTYWHTADWESSTTHHREGYIRDKVLYAGDFDEVNIHLFPRVRTVRVRSVDADVLRLRKLGFACAPDKIAHIFVHRTYSDEVASFCPTIFRFCVDGFVRVRKGEYVSREPQRAISAETISMEEALDRWNVEACYVDDLDRVINCLSRERVYFDEQT